MCIRDRYMIQCTFGGNSDRLLACGGEDSKIRIWHKNISKPQLTLSGHSLPVSCIAWHPKNPCLFVSGSDDYTVRVWVTDEIKQQYRKSSIMEEELEQTNPQTHEHETNTQELPQLFEEENSDDEIQNECCLLYTSPSPRDS
eukprot:TRINITY_DN21435_c0_g1_i1.p1 TRINITY_DN21435_c0_g1~~TRINITY_DN21435_c0_g1_i1.p1  ORF type:complete len:142 (+),score=23.87 TRINITY_DN21435_c0_g1_i1:64-489(+)